jgi:hypothetical protein
MVAIVRQQYIKLRCYDGLIDIICVTQTNPLDGYHAMYHVCIIICVYSSYYYLNEVVKCAFGGLLTKPQSTLETFYSTILV